MASNKKPTDRLPKADTVEEIVIRPEETPGWELMKPIEEVPVWDQVPLVATLQEAMTEAEDKAREKFEDANARRLEKGQPPLPLPVKKTESGKVARDEHGDPIPDFNMDFDVNIIGNLAKGILPFAKDEAELTRFMSGKGALNRTADLAMAWVGQMGESSSSDDS